MLSKKKILFLSISLSAVANGATVTMDSTKVLSLSISQEGITRLCVEGDEIKDIYVNPVYLQSNITLDDSGNLFFLGAPMHEAAYLSLVTSGGQVQDLKLSFSDKKPEPVFLQSAHISFSEKPLSLNSLKPEELMRGVLGNDLSDWQLINITEKIREREGFSAKPKAQYISKDGKYVLIKYLVEGEEGALPSPSVFQELNDLVISFNEKVLTKKTSLFVIKKGNTKQKNSS